MTSYSKLARFMAERQHPILRKYQHLAVRDLLYLQAEICDLESKYEAVARIDLASDDERKDYSLDWDLLRSSHTRGFGGKQWELALQIRLKLREYHDALLQYSKISSLRQPKVREADIVQKWIDKQRRDNNGGFIGDDLLGTPEQPPVYDSIYHKDLAILSDGHGEDDFFTKFINGPVLKAFHRLRESANYVVRNGSSQGETDDDLTPGMHYYDNAKVGHVTHLLGTVLSSLAPLSSIVALSFVKGDKARLGLICAFTLFFNLCLAIATKARRVEIFAATAAFASVQVVFVGSSGNG